jgi:4-hydroxybenzoate polyprenyltransferase
LKKILTGLVKLIHLDQYIYYVTITTLLGITAVKGVFGWRFLIALIANILSAGFIYMIRDIENAPVDALANHKINRNPIAVGLISPKTAKSMAFLWLMFSAGLYAALGRWPLILGLASLTLGFLSSYRGTKLSMIPVVDVLTRCAMNAGLHFLIGYLAFSPSLTRNWFWPFLSIIAISIFSQLHRQLYSVEHDAPQQQGSSAVFLGAKTTRILMVLLMVIGIFSAVVSLIVIELIPGWVFTIWAIMTAFLLLPQLLKINRESEKFSFWRALQNPMQRAGAIALLLFFLLPWLNSHLSLSF